MCILMCISDNQIKGTTHRVNMSLFALSERRFILLFLLAMDLMDISASTPNINNKCSFAYGYKSGGNLQVTSRVYVRLLPRMV